MGGGSKANIVSKYFFINHALHWVHLTSLDKERRYVSG